MSRLSFSIPGEPKGKGRPRAIARLDSVGEPFVQMVTPQDTRDEEARVLAIFRRAFPDHKPFTRAVQINFTAVFEIPASFNRAQRAAAERGELFATKKPDKDNIEKLIVDALNKHAWLDDAQVMGGGIKRYGSPARIDVSIKSLASPDVPATPGQRRAERQPHPELPLHPQKRLRETETKSETVGKTVAKDLVNYGPGARKLIEAALARDEAARAARKRP